MEINHLFHKAKDQDETFQLYMRNYINIISMKMCVYSANSNAVISAFLFHKIT